MSHKITLNKEECIGCELCSNIAPEIFKRDRGDENKVDLKKSEISDNELQTAKNAEDLCPVDVIKID
jgi:ferredoxin